eukprot:scaffold4733_cov170-Alexandrium_tamarense.AAC.6
MLLLWGSYRQHAVDAVYTSRALSSLLTLRTVSQWQFALPTATQRHANRVPLGFVCGYPVSFSGGEQYGGSMFLPSAATDTLQGRAIQHINNTWGSHPHSIARSNWSEGYKTIGIPVCKKKYRPFEFRVRRKNEKTGEVEIVVERMYGCGSHSGVRKMVIERHGERRGWEPFGQWSLSKAKAAARKETVRLNAELNENGSASGGNSEGYDSTTSSSEGETSSPPAMYCRREDITSLKRQQSWQTLCHNGMCNWKMKGKRDDICEEIESERLNKYDV